MIKNVIYMHPFPIGKGSLDLLHSAMRFVKRIYKHTTFELIDQSRVSCAKGFQIPLVHLHVAKYFKTWYEDKLGASPVQLPKYSQHMISLKSYLKTYPAFDMFAKENGMTDVQQKALVQLYDTSTSIHEFIKQITKEYDCYLCKGWLSTIVNRYFENSIYGTSWIVKCDVSHLIHVHKISEDAAKTTYYNNMRFSFL